MKHQEELPDNLKQFKRDDLSTPDNYFRVMQNSVLERLALEGDLRPEPERPDRRAPWWSFLRRPVMGVFVVFLLAVGVIIWANTAELDDATAQVDPGVEYVADYLTAVETDLETPVDEIAELQTAEDELDYYLDMDLEEMF